MSEKNIIFDLDHTLGYFEQMIPPLPMARLKVRSRRLWELMQPERL